MKKLMSLLLVIFLFISCQQKERDQKIIVGTMMGPETALMEVAKKVALQKGLHIKIISFADYNTLNEALNNGDINANAFQHLPYLQKQIKERNYHLLPLTKTFIYPMGIYSQKIKTLSELPMNAKIAIPNDPTNEARALLLLQKAKLISFQDKNMNITPRDIKTNPKKLLFVELDAAQLPRVLPDVFLAVINSNYALPSGLSLKQALFLENKNSLYANIIVIREQDKNNAKWPLLVAAFHSPAVMTKAQQLFGEGAIRAW